MACDQSPIHLKDKKDWKPFITSRCSPQRLHSIVTSLSPLQRSYVDKHGFGGLLSVINCSLPLTLVQWLLPKVRCSLAQVILNPSKVIKIDRNFVRRALGIPLGCTPIITSGSEDSASSLKKIYVRNGRGLTVKEAVALMQDDNNEESFIRSFILVVLSVFLCPNSSLNVNPQYLHSLVYVDSIGHMDWCSHVLQFLMTEIQKYQDATDFGRDMKGQKSIYVCGCLLLLPIVYLDFVDIESHRFPVGYPRIAYLRNEDYEVLQKLPISSTPHNLDIHNSSEFVSSAPSRGDSVPTSSGASISQIPDGLKAIVDKYLNLFAENQQEILSELIERMTKVHYDLSQKFVAEVVNYAVCLKSGGEKDGTHPFVGCDDVVEDVPFNLGQCDSDKDADFELRPRSVAGANCSSSCRLKSWSHRRSSGPLDFEGLNDNAGIDDVDVSHEKGGDVRMASVGCSDIDGAIPLVANVVQSMDKAVSSSQKTRKRLSEKEDEADCSYVPEHPLKRLRLSNDIKSTYNKYCLSLHEEKANQVIVEIDGIYLAWGEFKECMRPRGNISMLCMFFACKALLADWDGVRSKFILPPQFTSLLVVKPDEFNADSVAKELSADNRPFPLSECHVIFLPILKGEHWMLYVVNFLAKEINIFDSFNNVAADYHEAIKDNLAKNFSAAFKVAYPSYTDDISKFSFSSRDVPKQPNNYDCGVYVMKFMESWDGKCMDPFHPVDIPFYRQVLVHRWIYHPRNVYHPDT